MSLITRRTLTTSLKLNQMAKPPPIVADVIKYLDNLGYGTHVIDDFVAKGNQEDWKEIVKDYCQTHPEVYFTSYMKSIKKIDISNFYKKQKNEAA